MSAVIDLKVYYGDDSSPTIEDQSNLPLSGNDVSTTESLLQNPIYVVQDQVQHSFERWFKFKVNDMVDVEQIEDFKVYSPNQTNLSLNGDSSPNVDLNFGVQTIYQTPSDSSSSIQTSQIPTTEPATQNLTIGGNTTNSLEDQGDETDFGVLQLIVHPTQSMSDSFNIIVNYNEIIS